MFYFIIKKEAAYVLLLFAKITFQYVINNISGYD